MGRVTIYDVAARAGVSATTVYKAMNDLKGVSESRRASIQQLAKEMGYVSNPAAQALARRKLKIGVFFELLDSEFSYSMLEGIRSAYQDIENFNVSIQFSPTFKTVNKSGALKNFEEMLAADLDGIICCPSMPYCKFESYNDILKEKQIVLVLLNNRVPRLDHLISVQYDGTALGAAAGDIMNLCNPGGDNVVIVGNKDIDVQQSTIRGFQDSLRKTGGEVVNCYENRFSEDMNRLIVQDILSSSLYVTGIFVAVSQSKMVVNTLKAQGALDRFKLILVDDTPWTRSCLAAGEATALLDRHPFQMGQTSVNLIYNYLARKQLVSSEVYLPSSILLPSSVSVGASLPIL